MTGPILCGVDFSEDSRRALRWADFLARRLTQPLIIVHAVETVLASAAQVEYGENAIEQTFQPELEQFVSQTIGDRARVRLQFGVGEPADILRQTALLVNAGAIVLGTQGMGQAGRMVFGSTTTRVLRGTTMPVLAIPRRAASRSDAEPRVDQIVVGTDLDAQSDAVIAAAEELARTFDVPVLALHAVPEVAAPDRWSELVAQAVERGIRDARGRIGESVPAHWSSEVRTGSAATVLTEAASGSHALIVVGLGGGASDDRPGTTAYRVLSEADAPVFAVPGG